MTEALLAELGVERSTVPRATEVPGCHEADALGGAFDLSGLTAEYAAFADTYGALPRGDTPFERAVDAAGMRSM